MSFKGNIISLLRALLIIYILCFVFLASVQHGAAIRDFPSDASVLEMLSKGPVPPSRTSSCTFIPNLHGPGNC